MHDVQSEPNLSIEQKLQRCAILVQWVCRMWAAPVEVWLRTGFGERYFGFPALIAFLVWVPLFGTFFPDEQPAPLLVFWWSSLVMLFVARIEVARRWMRGEVEHRFYGGRSRFHRLFPRVSEPTMKAMVEPLFVLMTGIATTSLAAPLGIYLMGAAWALAVNTRITLLNDRRRLLELTDAAIEQRYLAEQFRQVMG